MFQKTNRGVQSVPKDPSQTKSRSDVCRLIQTVQCVSVADGQHPLPGPRKEEAAAAEDDTLC